MALTVRACPHCRRLDCKCDQDHRELVEFAARTIRGVAKDQKVPLAKRAGSLRRLLLVIQDAAEKNDIHEAELVEPE